jgi:hypothetical protein
VANILSHFVRAVSSDHRPVCDSDSLKEILQFAFLFYIIQSGVMDRSQKISKKMQSLFEFGFAFFPD